jgi:glycosyltransferase involved in cell wall biosynthesis
MPPGGGNAVAAWFIQALRDSWAITVFGWVGADVPAMNGYFGTSLRETDFSLTYVSASWRFFLSEIPLPLACLKRAILMRQAQKLAGSYDAVVSVNNEIDAGIPAIQYIHFPSALWPRPEEDLRWYHRWVPLLKMYYRLADRIGRVSSERVAGNLTLANSDWTGRAFRALYGTAARTLYPPVVAAASQVPWDERENGFVCVGRISPEKRIETVVEILRRVRARGHDVRLHLAGTASRDRYSRRILGLLAQEPWARFHENLSREELGRLAAARRYGIHGMEAEHFGMAPAELAAAGCIVFVPDGGGQVEIVEGDDRLTFRGVDDAAAKIDRVLRSSALQEELRAKLAPARERFSPVAFQSRVREILRSSSHGGP